jgi:hypothetical protein
VSLIKAKSLNRTVYLELEEKRTAMETRKVTVDKLQLSYENLLYKQAYLQREIRSCKDLSTPNLTKIETELGEKLGTTVYSDRLDMINTETREKLTNEQSARIETEKLLEACKETRNQELKKLDRKRKFLDELPNKMQALSKAVADVDKLFVAAHK